MPKVTTLGSLHHEPRRRRNAESQAAVEKEKQVYDVFTAKERGESSSRRSGFGTSGVFESIKTAVGDMKAYQAAAIFFALFMMAWGGIVTFVMLDFSIRYIFSYVEHDREQYMVEAALALVQSQAGQALLVAHHARDAICIAIQSGIMNGSSFADVERVLAPALLSSSFLSNVEMSFSDSNDMLVVGHRTAADGGFLLTIQSTAGECFLLGVEGCIDSPGLQGQRPEWFERYTTLPIDTSMGYGTSGAAGEPGANLSVRSAWEEPVLVPTKWGLDGSAVAWAPSYRLGFRCGATVEVAGRVTLELGGFSGSGADGWFSDPRLGRDAEFYLLDRSGTVLASQLPEDLLVVKDGRLRFANVWELGKGWAPQLRSAFTDAGVEETRLLHQGREQVVLRQLTKPLEHFAVVLVAPDYWQFVNMPLYVCGALSMALAGAPWLIGLVAVVVLFAQSWRLNSQLKTIDPTKTLRKADSSFSLTSHDIDNSWNLVKMLRRGLHSR